MNSKEKLLEMLASDDGTERYGACELLRVSEESSPEIVHALMNALHDRDEDVVGKARAALKADVHHQMAINLGLIKEEKVESEDSKPITFPTAVDYCPKCNQANTHGSQYCNNCGASLSVDSTPKKKSHKVLWIVLGSVLGVLVIAIIVCVLSIGKLSSEATPIADVLDAFMNAMVVKDVEGAYALTSPSFQE
ncbi:MAG: hypothetical protein C3F13_07200 [Anaerolineales bacterium]|nr:zinc ribbon domain-containing protein [Anaerolineae bacterium]PWB54071.1 MAG: hypothetical protein C3F13_07200 [Anaerolineales bacterium]